MREKQRRFEQRISQNIFDWSAFKQMKLHREQSLYNRIAMSFTKSITH